MNELIPITEKEFNGETIKTVNARELHNFLEVGKDFSNWIKDRIEQYDFVENQDFTIFAKIGENSQVGRPSKEYFISLDMAKELAMVERNEKGKQARQYFIECERVALSAPKFDIAQITKSDLAKMILESEEEKRILQIENQKKDALIEANAPKVEFADRVSESSDTFLVRQVAKILGLPVLQLYKYLQVKGLISKNKEPYSLYVQRGILTCKVYEYTDQYGKHHQSWTPLVTGIGLRYLHDRLIREGVLVPTHELILE